MSTSTYSNTYVGSSKVEKFSAEVVAVELRSFSISVENVPKLLEEMGWKSSIKTGFHR